MSAFMNLFSKPKIHTTKIKFNLALLISYMAIKEKYKISVKNKFEALGEAKYVKQELENFKTT